MMYAYNVCILISNYWGEEMVTLSSPFHVSSLTHLSHRISVLMLRPLLSSRALIMSLFVFPHVSVCAAKFNLRSHVNPERQHCS